MKWILTVFIVVVIGCSGEDKQTDDSLLSNIVYVDADGSAEADGTRSSPFTLEQAIELESEIVVLLGQAGPFVGLYELSPNQSLIGGGDLGVANYVLPSGDRINISDLGGRPVIVNVDDPVISTYPITLSNNTMIAGIEILGGNSGIYCHRTDNVKLEDIYIGRSEFHGIELLSCNNQTIKDITIVDVEIFSGIRIFDSMDININSVHVLTSEEPDSNRVNVGIDISGSNYVEIDGFYMNYPYSTGIDVNGISEIYLSNIVVEKSIFTGLEISANEIYLSDINITDTGYEGANLEGEIIQINEIELSSIGSNGLVFDQHVDAGSLNISIDNLVINNASVGLYFFSAENVVISGSNNSFTDVDTLCLTNGEIDISDNLEISQGLCIESP